MKERVRQLPCGHLCETTYHAECIYYNARKTDSYGDGFAETFCKFFSGRNEHLLWLMTNSKERMFKIEVFKDGILLKQIEVSRARLKQTGTYDVDSEGWGFGASGYEDLPNSRYVSSFRQFLFGEIKDNCPAVIFTDEVNGYLKLADNVKKSW